MAGVRLAAASATTAAVTGRLPARREELIDRELEAVKYVAGILRVTAPATAAIAFWHADVVGGHQELDVALEADDAELPQCDEQAAAIVVQDDILAKHLADGVRDFA